MNDGLCSKCHAEPRCPGQRWGKNCRAAASAARRAAVPHETRGTVSRREQEGKLHRWLLDNRGRLEREDLTAIALELRRAGFYSKKTAPVDIRCGLRAHCNRLGLPFRGGLLAQQIV